MHIAGTTVIDKVRGNAPIRGDYDIFVYVSDYKLVNVRGNAPIRGDYDFYVGQLDVDQ